MARNSGFTLIEILVVLAIVAASAAFTLGSLKPAPRTELRNAAADVAAALRTGRNHAATGGRSSEVRLDLAERSLEVDGRPFRRRLPRNLQISLYTARSELSARNSGAIRFFPDGTSTGGRVTLGRPGTGRLGIDVDWLTSRVRLLEAEGT